MAKILIVEDEAKIARFVELELKYEGYEVEIAGDGNTGLAKALEPGVDLLVLDVMLPGLSGLEVCRKIRERGSSLPIIMLTAKDDISDKVSGLDNGADDYMTKPFDIEELLARIRAALNRSSRLEAASNVASNAGNGQGAGNSATENGTFGSGEFGDSALGGGEFGNGAPKNAAIGNSVPGGNGKLLSVGELTVNTASYTVTYGGEELSLTKKEFELLAYLLRHRGEAVTRDRLLSEVWEYEYMGDTNVVDVYIRYLRQKIDDRFGVKIISTVRGVGYIVK